VLGFPLGKIYEVFLYDMTDKTFNNTNGDSKANGRFNGKMNGMEGKTPFLIGVAGGTASGKVSLHRTHIEFSL